MLILLYLYIYQHVNSNQLTSQVGLGDRSNVQARPDGVVADENTGSNCLVAIGRLQVTSTPNSSDLAGSNSNNGKFIFFVKYNCQFHLLNGW